MSAQIAWSLAGLAFALGLACGFGLWDAIDRTRWTLYRRAYRHCCGINPLTMRMARGTSEEEENG